mgnify:CR=1 FL=1
MTTVRKIDNWKIIDVSDRMVIIVGTGSYFSGEPTDQVTGRTCRTTPANELAEIYSRSDDGWWHLTHVSPGETNVHLSTERVSTTRNSLLDMFSNREGE